VLGRLAIDADRARNVLMQDEDAEPDWIELIGARSLGSRPLAAASRKRPPLGPPSPVLHIQPEFRQWDGPVGEWRDHFGKGRGQVHSLDGKDPLRSCNEVEIAKLLRRVREHAYWFSQYSVDLVPQIWRPWVRSLGAETPAWLAAFDGRVRERVHSRRGGMPDVVAWNDDDPLQSAFFIECKGPDEPFSESQEDWVLGAREAGLQLSQLGVSLRRW
jgi:hypothetical protein